MSTGHGKPPRIVPESAQTLSSSLHVMIADPVVLTTRRTVLLPVASSVFTGVQVPPARRLAVKIGPRTVVEVAPDQATMALPDPSIATIGAWAPTLMAPMSVPRRRWTRGESIEASERALYECCIGRQGPRNSLAFVTLRR